MRTGMISATITSLLTIEIRVNKFLFFTYDRNFFCLFQGKTVEVPYRGEVKNTILDILGGLRSACTYVGAGKLKELPKRTTFIRVTQQVNEVFK